jgi:hypothetical protein
MQIVDLLLGIVVLGYIVVRQVRARPVRSFNPRVPPVLGLVLAAVLGAVRAGTVRLWSDGGVAWSRA